MSKVLAWLLFSAAHLVGPSVVSAAPSSSPAAALGLRVLVAAGKLPLLGRGGPQE